MPSTIGRQAFNNMKFSNYYEQNPIKFGGSGLVVQVDETMLNHKVKEHRGKNNNTNY